MTLDRIDPFGVDRSDVQTGILASLIANVHRDPKKTKIFKPIDFMPFQEKPKPQRRSGMQAYNFLKTLSK